MATDVLGARIKRVEDPKFITGRGRYLDDISMPGMTHVAILRSPYAHATFTITDISDAKAAPAGDELRVFDPLDAGAEDVGGHRSRLPGQAGTGAAAPSRMTAAACRIATTMLW